MKCSNCGTDNNELATFCRKCGAKLNADAPGAYRPPEGLAMGAAQVDEGLAALGAASGFGPAHDGAAKGRTVVDPNVRGARAAGVGAAPRGAAPIGRAKSKTAIDTGDPASAASDKGSSAPDAARKLAAFIVSYSNNPMGDFHPIYEGRVKVGSNASECEVVVNDKQVSGTHALLLFRRGTFSIRDQDSSNGTFVDTHTVSRDEYPDLFDGTGAAALKSGDFSGRDISFIGSEDERILLKDNSYFMIGTTVFKVKTVN